LLPLVFGSAVKLVGLVLNIYFYSFIILVVISWVAPHTQNPAISVVNSLTEPVLRPIRKLMPSMGGLDFSIMIAMLGILVIKIVLGVN
jgi:YggT family protein